MTYYFNNTCDTLSEWSYWTRYCPAILENRAIFAALLIFVGVIIFFCCCKDFISFVIRKRTGCVNYNQPKRILCLYGISTKFWVLSKVILRSNIIFGIMHYHSNILKRFYDFLLRIFCLRGWVEKGLYKCITDVWPSKEP